MRVYRPCDGYETTAGWVSALTNKGPTCLILSRQTLKNYGLSNENALKGGYVFADSKKATPDAIIISCGSEIECAMKAKELLYSEGVDVRVVSMPCMELFDKQSESYKESVLPNAVRKRVCVEAGATIPWYKYASIDGKVLGIDEFGRSGKAQDLFNYYGFTAENVKDLVLSLK